ncbi:ATP-binding cassette domain-containing protein, partial [Bacillus safensis]|nr:ATP-binding cassette domain-containing protein [Bacillus safensis]
METKPAVIQGNDLSVDYDGSPALTSVNVSVSAGRITAICGANGSGKSTLLRCMARLQKASQGTVLFEGRNISGMRRNQLARKVAVLG